MVILVCTYAYIKIDVFLLKKGIDIMTSTQNYFYDSDYVFDYSQGLNFAIAFTANDDETEDILDPSYGKISFIRYEWGSSASGAPYV